MTRARDIADQQENLGGAVAPFVAGKNKIINGDFGVWQRGTSGFGLGAAFNADRWAFYRDGSGATEAITQQTFTPGTAPVSGYEGQYFWRYAATVAGTGATERSLYTKIEDVRTFANQTVTVSFWAKADAARTINLFLAQNFGSGGSASVITSLTGHSVTTSWARYSTTVAVPSISGKTVGTSSFLQLTMSFPVNVIETIDIWGVQLEAGSVATPFTTASGTIQGELALCQRYYYRNTSGAAFVNMGNGAAISTTASTMDMQFPVTMRAVPTSIDFSTIRLQDFAAGYAITSLTIGTNGTGFQMGEMTANVASGLTSGKVYWIGSNNSSTAYIAFSAELQEMTMDNVTFVFDQDGIEHAIIDRGNGEFTSMPKSVYDAQVGQTVVE